MQLSEEGREVLLTSHEEGMLNLKSPLALDEGTHDLVKSSLWETESKMAQLIGSNAMPNQIHIERMRLSDRLDKQKNVVNEYSSIFKLICQIDDAPTFGDDR